MLAACGVALALMTSVCADPAEQVLQHGKSTNLALDAHLQKLDLVQSSTAIETYPELHANWEQDLLQDDETDTVVEEAASGTLLATQNHKFPEQVLPNPAKSSKVANDQAFDVQQLLSAADGEEQAVQHALAHFRDKQDAANATRPLVDAAWERVALLRAELKQSANATVRAVRHAAMAQQALGQARIEYGNDHAKSMALQEQLHIQEEVVQNAEVHLTQIESQEAQLHDNVERQVRSLTQELPEAQQRPPSRLGASSSSALVDAIRNTSHSFLEAGTRSGSLSLRQTSLMCTTHALLIWLWFIGAL